MALAQVAPRLGITAAGQYQLRIERVHRLSSGGDIAIFRATVGGLPLRRGALKLLLDEDGRLRAWSAGDALLGGLDENLAGGPARFAEEDAARIAARAVFAQDHRTLGLTRPARVRAVATVSAGAARQAWEVELWGKGGETALSALVDASSGVVLETSPLTFDAAFHYRVWAREGGDLRPLDGPLVDLTPHPTGEPDGAALDATAPALVAVEGLNTNPDGADDPWLDATATTTAGNNAVAYADHADPNGLSDGDLEAGLTDTASFDHTYDTSLEPVANETQTEAAIVQAFYTVNWLHDRFYDAGFDEAAGNAQADNMGRGGKDGDPLLVEVQDGVFDGLVNNAVVTTPADGSSPRMTIYVWSAPVDASLEVASGWWAEVGVAAFGPETFELTGLLAEAGSDTLACGEVDGEVEGRVVLVDRGRCSYQDKTANAEDAGALGVVLVNDVGGRRPT